MPWRARLESGLEEAVVEAGVHRVLEADAALLEGARKLLDVRDPDSLVAITPETEQRAVDPVDLVERPGRAFASSLGAPGAPAGKP